MNKELMEALNVLEREKDISKDVILEAIENSLLTAYKVHYGKSDNVTINIDHQTGDYKILAAKQVVEVVEDRATQISLEDAWKISKKYQLDDVVSVEVKSKEFGRIATQNAKNIITQKIREEERRVLFDKYYGKEKDVVTGIVQRINDRNISINLGKVDAILNESEQVPGERLMPNDRIKLYVTEVKDTSRGPKILVSRTHPELVKRLFEAEVSEVKDGTVEIMGISREAGSRSKISVRSNDSNVDPVGACVGLNGTRVNAIVNELRGEKIDIVNWNENPAVLIENALSPAKVVSVIANDEEKTARVVVPDYQLSLAIGKEGQNARLAARLTGFKIDIKSESQAKQAEELEKSQEPEKFEQTQELEELEMETVIEGEDESTMIKRPPVVCVMGHVDHGKTSLLDAIRKTNVISGEAGGITQHIGAYVVNYNGEKITFLDTPGHEAFTAMRMRGAQATDIAILVVAADDGVMPQTVEAISHAKAAGISIIVAVNKIDKPSANVEKVKQELAEYELLAEDWGGETVFVPVSAHTREGLDQLLEMVLLTAEINELKANPNRKARGVVIEAKLDKGRGPVATVLIQKGILKSGDAVAIGSAYGRVRAMVDDNGGKIKEAGPSTPVEILGLNSVPNAGEVLMATKNEKEARSIAETFIKEGREKLLEGTKAKAKMTLDDVFNQIQAGNLKELNIIVKADVQGSVEAVKQSLVKLSNDEVVVKVIHGGVGTINESDVTLASASNAIIIGFNVRPDNTAKETAEHENVDLRLYKVIYQAIEDVEAAMKGMLDPVFEEKVIGHAEIRQLFKSSGVGMIAGSYVLDGYFQRGCKIRISREGKQIYEGELASLKRFKDDVKEVKAGYECGLVFEGFTEFTELDIAEAYIMVEVPR